MPREHIHFVTGKLAEPSLRRVVDQLAPVAGFDHSIETLKISVAALMTPEWVAPRVNPPPEATRVMLPGYCAGDLSPVEAKVRMPVSLGPRDLRDLPEHFAVASAPRAEYGKYDIEILAEINHAPRLSLDELLAAAAALVADGADVIDVGCIPGQPWAGVGDAVRALCAAGHRVSIDSMDVGEIDAAAKAGAELVLSVNSSNVRAARDWGREVVAVPDEPATLGGLDETIVALTEGGVPFRIDPILEPIGFGFAASLARYQTVRARYPNAEMMMGVGNLTELTDADSAAINVLLLGFCQEVGIRSVLTTQVINWARSSVRECDLARRLVHFAVTERTLPKRVEPRLVLLRDPRPHEFGAEGLARLAAEIKDNNYRLFAERGRLHLVSAGLHLESDDPFDLFAQLSARNPRHLDPSHAFYLGYELAKAATALALGKDYRQDQALEWGFLTVPERNHRGGGTAPAPTADLSDS